MILWTIVQENVTWYQIEILYNIWPGLREAVCTHPCLQGELARGVFSNFSYGKTEDFHAWAFIDLFLIFSWSFLDLFLIFSLIFSWSLQAFTLFVIQKFSVTFIYNSSEISMYMFYLHFFVFLFIYLHFSIPLKGESKT